MRFYSIITFNFFFSKPIYFFGVMNDDFYYNITDNIFELSYEEVIKYAKDNNFYDSTYEKLNLLINNDKPTIEFYKSLL